MGPETVIKSIKILPNGLIQIDFECEGKIYICFSEQGDFFGMYGEAIKKWQNSYNAFTHIHQHKLAQEGKIKFAEDFCNNLSLSTASPEGDVDAIMEDMLERAKELDNEGLCLGLFTIQQILTKHLGEGKKEVEMCESEGDCVCPLCGAFDVKNYCPGCGVKIKRVEHEGEQKEGNLNRANK